MNLSALYELKEQLEAAAVYGTGLMTEDFRLKKAAAQMGPLAQAAPVFKKIEQAAQAAIAPECQDRPGALMDALALVNAVVYTQGTVGAAGEFLPLEGGGCEQNRVCAGEAGSLSDETGREDREEKSLSFLQNIPYSRMAPLVAALTGTGGGRYAVLESAVREEPELLSDWRLLRLMIEALGDSYGEIGNLVYRRLLEMGSSIVPMLCQGFDSNGKRGMLLRLRLIGELAGASENQLYRKAAMDGEKSIREEAIGLLRFDSENVPLLYDMLKTEKGVMRNRVLWTLSFMELEEPEEYLNAMKKKKPSEAAGILCGACNVRSADLMADVLEQFRKSVITEMEKAGEEYRRTESLLASLDKNGTLEDGTTASQLRKKRDQLCKQMQWDRRQSGKDLNWPAWGTDEEKIWRAAEGKCSDKLFEWLRRAYAETPGFFPPFFFYDSFCDSPTEEMASFIERMFREFGDSDRQDERRSGIEEAVFARALLTETAEAVNQKFSPWLAGGRASAILQVLCQIQYSEEKKQYVFMKQSRGKDSGGRTEEPVCFENLDRRWYGWLLLPGNRTFVRKNVKVYTGQMPGQGYALERASKASEWSCLEQALVQLYCPEAEGLSEAYRAHFESLIHMGLEIDSRLLRILRRCGFRDYDFVVERVLRENQSQYLWRVKCLLEEIPLPASELSESLGRALERDRKGTIAGRERIQIWREQLADGACVGELA